MVKGVSKTVIEVNNTGSKLFEKIVFYVTPEYGNLSAKQLKKAASAFSFQYDANYNRKPLRHKYKRKKLLLLASVTLALLAVIGCLILIL